jgi:DNA-binding NarL/FixJ family response regulator
MVDKRKPGILIVDDDKQVLKSLKMWLRNEGFRPMTASDGNEAEAVIKDNVIEVALVDFKMGKEDGIDVAQRLGEVDNRLKIIMLTGFPSYETAVKAMKVGIFDYISKGSSNGKILDAINNAVEEREREINLGHHELLSSNRIRLILFCNHSLLKERLQNLSKSNPTFQLVNAFPSVRSGGAKSISQQVDIALVCASCNLKDLKDAYRLLPEFYRIFPEVKTIIINENFSDQEKVELLELGIRGFASRELSSEDLEKTLLHVNKGEIWVSRSVINLSLRRMSSYKTPKVFNYKSRFQLTEREIEILRAMALGLKNKQIAEKLFISEKTVKTHINRLFKKLGVNTRAKAVLTAVENQVF